MATWCLPPQSFRCRQKRQAGFSLMEMLVVLVLVALVSGVLLDTLGQLSRAGERTRGTVARLADTVLDEALVQAVLTGVVPEYREGPGVFQGTADGLTALTLAGLDSPADMPVTMRLSIGPVGDGRLSAAAVRHRLTYEGRGEPLTLLEWAGGPARFRYLAPDGTWQESWDGEARRPRQVPEAVMLEFPPAAARPPLVIAPGAPGRWLIHPGDTFDDL